MNVETVESGAVEEWQQYVATEPESTVYHSFGWRRIFEESFGYRSWYLMARDESGAIAGCLPLFLVTSPAARRLVAVPFRDRGGLLWRSSEAFHALIEAARTIATEMRAAYIEIKSVTSYPDDLIRQAELDVHHYWIRSTVDLRDLDVDSFWRRIGAKTRNMIRQAESAGLTFADETFTPSAVATWYALFLATQKRQGLPPFPRRFFATMFDELAKSQELRLFVVRHGGEPIAGTLVLLHMRVGIYGYSASSDSGRAHRPNDLMLFNTARWLMENGYQEFDLGSDSPRQESLLFFKRKWLAEQRPVPLYTAGRHTMSHSDSSDARYRVIRRAFQHLPTPLLRFVGAATCRYFG